MSTAYNITFTSSDPIIINSLHNRKALYILRAINHTLRLKILQCIDERKQISVTDIYKQLNIAQAIASQHLAVLRKAGFVTTTKQGKVVFYQINQSFMAHFSTAINHFLSIT